MRAYEVRSAIDDFRHVDIRFGKTVAKVRAAVVSSARDAWPDLTFKHVRVRFVGERSTPQEIAQRKCDAFNKLAPVGTWVLVRQFIGDEGLEYAFCTRVRAPVCPECSNPLSKHGACVWCENQAWQKEAV